jgi:D-alanyl-D-alanine carboxypeptidase/D-alanyl-D-alanine-endopeptidase (penicillin-binding protein 4)
VTPSDVTRLLRHMTADRLAYPAYLISLPVSGVDGTLAGRLGASTTRGRLRAKTGTMSGVSGLAGYLDTPQGPMAVAVFVNGFAGSATAARDLQDKLVEALTAPEELPR